MIVTRRFPAYLLLAFTARLAGGGALWSLAVFGLYAYAELHVLRQPFLPIATIGTAVAFYVGFKNNASYERFWEARKIWGGIVNASRSWATAVVAQVCPGDEGEAAREIRRTLIYRQMAWINALRLQLRRTSRFHDKPARTTKRRLERHRDHMRNDWELEIAPFVSPAELKDLEAVANPATHLLTRQGKALAGMIQEKRLDLFHQISMMELITELFTLQGQCERIKNTPFPRQYAEYSRFFTHVFVFLVPFGLLDVFGDQVDQAATTLQTLAPAMPMVVAGSLITWVFRTMESIGDSSEDPFERGMNDVPMNALCRAIEIDLRQILGETEVPAKEEPAGWILY